MIKPLDIVETPKGGIAVVTECSPARENYKFNSYSISYIKNPGHEYNAWWNEDELKFLASIPVIIGEAMCHPFGDNKPHVKPIFNNEILH
jgi:hypothetical protein